MLAAGKYDEETKKLAEELKAKGVILLVLDGIKGTGMSCETDPMTLLGLPAKLRLLADKLEGPVVHDALEAMGNEAKNLS